MKQKVSKAQAVLREDYRQVRKKLLYQPLWEPINPPRGLEEKYIHVINRILLHSYQVQGVPINVWIERGDEYRLWFPINSKWHSVHQKRFNVLWAFQNVVFFVSLKMTELLNIWTIFLIFKNWNLKYQGKKLVKTTFWKSRNW